MKVTVGCSLTKPFYVYYMLLQKDKAFGYELWLWVKTVYELLH